MNLSSLILSKRILISNKFIDCMIRLEAFTIIDQYSQKLISDSILQNSSILSINFTCYIYICNYSIVEIICLIPYKQCNICVEVNAYMNRYGNDTSKTECVVHIQ